MHDKEIVTDPRNVFLLGRVPKEFLFFVGRHWAMIWWEIMPFYMDVKGQLSELNYDLETGVGYLPLAHAKVLAKEGLFDGDNPHHKNMAFGLTTTMLAKPSDYIVKFIESESMFSCYEVNSVWYLEFRGWEKGLVDTRRAEDFWVWTNSDGVLSLGC